MGNLFSVDPTKCSLNGYSIYVDIMTGEKLFFFGRQFSLLFPKLFIDQFVSPAGGEIVVLAS